MTAEDYLFASVSALSVIALSFLALPVVYAGRVAPGVHLEHVALGGVSYRDLPGVLAGYEHGLRQRPVELVVRDQKIQKTLGDLGVSLHVQPTVAGAEGISTWDVMQHRGQVRPAVTIDSIKLEAVTRSAFAQTVKAPRNAGLSVGPGTNLLITKSMAGEGIERVTLEGELSRRAERGEWQRPFTLAIVPTPAEIQDHEVMAAKAFGEQLLRDGMQFYFEGTTWDVKPFTIRRLIEFVELPDEGKAANHVLGIQFKSAELAAYLTTTIAPEINRLPQNARFEMNGEGQVTQFAVPERGQELVLTDTAVLINQYLVQQQRSVPLAVVVTQPSIDSADDITALGITTKLTSGQTDFAGSPRNRIHNITVGTARYHGLLIPPGHDFSFNEHLGPVTAEAGFKPELVIKHNVTTPEFGGGLCQVSTTLFRAAVQAGLDVTVRRNHAYAVRYYGTPGFDATIYPPYTDLRFTNNTPGYILIQARVEGTRLLFDFWGTPDGRTVAVDGPYPYDRQPDGSVKATLKQTVHRADGELLSEKSFYSRYKSPNLFPKVIAANQG